jgi:integrase
MILKQQVKGREVVEYLKTESGFRIVDLCPELAEYLRKFVGDRKGPLFPSQKRTTPISYGNFLKRYLTPSMKKLGIKEPGKAAHAFRRFRSSILAKSGVEEDIRKFWLGHENNITAQYAEQIRDDNTWRQTLAAKVGLGFQIPAFVPKPIVRNVRNVRKNRQFVEVAVVS